MRSRLVAAASRWQQCSLLHPVAGADLRLVMQPFRLDCPVRSPALLHDLGGGFFWGY